MRTEDGVAKHYIGGRWRASTGSETIQIRNPASGEPVTEIPAGTEEDAAAAVQAAKAAFPSWSERSVDDRAQLLRNAVKRIRDNAAELARLETIEMGKPIRFARELIEGASAVFDKYADRGIEYFRAERTIAGSAERDRVLRVPRGVAALIVPWNFPMATTFSYLPGMLVAGNTVVYKPSERSPLSAIRLVELLELPDGVLNLLLGDRRSGAPLVEQADVDFVCFTGSVASGRHVAMTAGANLSAATLELGGKDPVIVDENVDPAWAAHEVAKGAFLNTGQICTSMERIYVHRAVAQPFIDELVRAAESEVVGDPLDQATTLGPLVDDRQRSVVHEHVAEAVERGAKVLTGGDVPDGPGSYYPPTVLVDVADDMKVMTEETFGPVAPVRIVDSFDEALEMAKGTEYGLAATVLTKDRRRAERAARELPAAFVWVNEWWGGVDAEGEPARASGVGSIGENVWLDRVTRPVSVHFGEPP